MAAARTGLTEFEKGFVIGILVGEGSFGGDGRQPHVVVKMHVRHEGLLRWLHSRFPGSRLYGPYSYDGRNFFQWMVRGRALAQQLIPLLDEVGLERLDPHVGTRYAAMKQRYAPIISRALS